MNQIRRSFDWLAFWVRVIVIAALATWLLIERLKSGDRIGAALVVCIGYIFLPALAYVLTRYYNSKFMFGVPEAVRRKIADHRRDA
ncbi:MAG TPA: hypothetical protein VN517_12215 [Terriglobales bacterium]|nr:hypothetical protein [Terriglobales bacterium]